MPSGTPREAAFLVCLSEAYELAGRKMSDTTILSAAKEMAARIPCADNEIKELFAKAREYSDIPTLKVLWKAMEWINENRVVTPSSTLGFDKQSSLIRRINVDEALRILCIKIGKYADLCTAYVHEKINGKYVYKYPNLKHDFDNEMMPLLEKICGNKLGDNPYDPNHPIQRYGRRL